MFLFLFYGCEKSSLISRQMVMLMMMILDLSFLLCAFCSTTFPLIIWASVVLVRGSPQIPENLHLSCPV